jgi:hypothetical protein
MYMGTKMQMGAGAMRGLFALLLLLSVNVLSAQSDLSADKSQISKLLTGLSDHSVKPSDVLDPSMNAKERATNLGFFDDPSYQLSLVPVGAIDIKPNGSAVVPVKVSFKTANKEMAAQSTAEFVKRDQGWYFASFSFVAFPTVIIAVIVVGVLVGISYATGVLLLRRKLLRQGKLDWGNRAKIFIPIFWPRLFSQS